MISQQEFDDAMADLVKAEAEIELLRVIILVLAEHDYDTLPKCWKDKVDSLKQRQGDDAWKTSRKITGITARCRP
jgi:hypothetical protein